MGELDIISDPLGPAARSTRSLLGLSALVSETRSHGMPIERLLTNSGLRSEQLLDPSAGLTLQQRITLYGNASRGGLPPAIGLTAGSRQRLTDYSFFGFAMASSATLREALEFAVQHLMLAGPTQQVHLHVEPGVAILKSSGYQYLGDLVPFAAEFWRSSFTTLFELVLKRPLPTRLMTFPYKAPAHWREYGKQFHCRIEFDADAMEWHLDESALDQQCPDANASTAVACREICQRLVGSVPGESRLTRRIRLEVANTPGQLISADKMALRLQMSERSMFRRIAAEHTSYQEIVDDTRSNLAQECLRDRSASVEDVALKLGYSEPASFRRAFRRWTGETPSTWRAMHLPRC